MAPTVAVIGAGPLGLMALKNFKETGFKVTGFDARSYVGGLWRYATDDYLSVAEGTIFNSSRYRSAIPDFPFDDDVDDFPTWRQMHEYFQKYTDYFELRPHIKLNSRITRLSREGDRWAIEITPSDSGEPRTEYFDKVAVAIGSFYKPRYPHIDGIEEFQGSTIHHMKFHGSPEVKGKNILLIGLHASAQDVAVTLKNHGAAQVYASHRNGINLVARYTPTGTTFDQDLTLGFTKFQIWLTDVAPSLFYWLLNTMLRRMSLTSFPNQPESLTALPVPSLETTAPLLADELYPLLNSGFVKPVGAVKRVVGPKFVELADGRVIDDMDQIIYCTGYDPCIPFIDKEHDPYPVVGEPPVLYRNTYPLHSDPAVRNSLVFLGHAAVVFPGLVQHELITLATCMIWTGKSQLPPLEDMRKWYSDNRAWRNNVKRRQKRISTFYTFFMPFSDHLRFFDSMSGTDVFSHFGWSWKAWQFWWSDRELYNRCMKGLFTPTIFRLFDSGKRKAWPQARAQIIHDQNFAVERAAKRKTVLEEKKRKQEESKKIE